MNGAFKLHNGRRMSQAYKDWRDAAGLELISQRPRKHLGCVEASVRFRAPDRRRRDADNFLKAVLDLCVRHGVIVDDSDKQLDGFDVRRVDDGAPVTVTIRSLK